MYLTAQRVEGRGREGINAFLHDAPNENETNWKLFDEGHIEIGDLIRQRVTVPPGLNSVLSFVDLVGPGELTGELVRSLLDTPPSRGTGQRRSWSLGSIEARFVWCGGSSRQPDLDQDLRELVWEAAALLDASDREPLAIRRTIADEGLLFELSPESIRRLKARHGPQWQAARLRAPVVTLEQWRSEGLTNVEERVIKVLTGLTDEELAEERGVRTATTRD